MNVLDRLRGRFRPPHEDVLIVHDGGQAWKVYRCDHLAEQLGYVGMSGRIARSDEIDLVAAVEHYQAFILNRVEWTDGVAAFVEIARQAHKDVFFGTDDLIFEPELEPCFAFLDKATAADHARWRSILERYRLTLEACGTAIASTDPLADRARRYVGDVRVVYNAVSEQMVSLAEDAVRTRSYLGGVTIGYLSGTPSHNRDFVEAADAVLSALGTYPQVRLLIVGQLDLDPRFDQFEARITRVPKQSLEAVPALAARVDINLAPLERDNPVTACKSCVKYLEAGLVGVPTIASARPDFVRVIDQGRNGFLADDADEWSEALRELIESSERRRMMGTLAYEDVRRNHTTKAGAPALGHLLQRRAARAVVGVVDGR